MFEASDESISRRTRGLDRAFEILDFLGQPARGNASQ